jgi:hypothetical protein
MLIDRLGRRKRLVAKFTVVPLVVVHLIAVTLQRMLRVVTLIALITLKRLLAGMRSHMNPQWCQAAKLFPTNRTLFAAQHLEVFAQMRFERVLFHELLCALGTLKLLLTMDGLVERQLQLTLEILAANVALFRSVSAVRHQMRLQVDFEREAATAELADKLFVGVFAGVVFLEAAAILEFDGTVYTCPGNDRECYKFAVSLTRSVRSQVVAVVFAAQPMTVEHLARQKVLVTNVTSRQMTVLF